MFVSWCFILLSNLYLSENFSNKKSEVTEIVYHNSYDIKFDIKIWAV